MIHNGSYTVTNLESGAHRTFRVKTQADDAKFAPKRRLIELLTGSDNEKDYQSFAFLNCDEKTGIYSIQIWNRHKGTDGKASNFEIFADMLGVLLLGRTPTGARSYSGYSIACEKRCLICNRLLTNPESLETGIGPECAKREAKKNKKNEAFFSATI